MPRASLEVFCFYCTTITLKVGSSIDAIRIHFPAFKPDMFECQKVSFSEKKGAWAVVFLS